MADKENVQKLRKENNDLKSQVKELGKEMVELRSKMAAFVPETSINNSIEFVSKELNDLKSIKAAMENTMNKLESKLREIDVKAKEIDEAIEEMLKYSYQYNIKIFGVPQRNRRESATESADICLKLFRKIGVSSVSLSDIDIAHRVPNSRASSQSSSPIVCKFTRRLAKEQVMKNKRATHNINPSEIITNSSTGQSWSEIVTNGSPSSQQSNRIRIYEHLTPRSQQLFKEAKDFQRTNDFKYCWTKNSNIFLKEDDDSKIIKVTSAEMLQTM